MVPNEALSTFDKVLPLGLAAEQSSDSDDIIKSCVEIVVNSAHQEESDDQETAQDYGTLIRNTNDAAYYEDTPKEVAAEEDEEEDGNVVVRVRRVPRESEMVRPCTHNNWTKQTKKRGKLVLKCMVCKALWKTYPEFHTKCIDFHNGKCEKGAECEHPHVYARRDAKTKKTQPEEFTTARGTAPVHYYSVFEAGSPSSYIPDPRAQQTPQASPGAMSFPTTHYASFEGSTEGFFPPMSNHVNSHAQAASIPGVQVLPQQLHAKSAQQETAQPQQVVAQPVVAAKPEPRRVWAHDPYSTVLM
eukprot:TRINITY_DN19161_c1_g2_i2.p1 TRINITY_DN19161_c1_g2~~TRINITY_DN19161_c1_g2_i2.p1  ORF type:complete len:342 (+),score=119.53 TRINITY_DN19161_c1_g2_i2:124-1026(+)